MENLCLATVNRIVFTEIFEQFVVRSLSKDLYDLISIDHPRSTFNVLLSKLKRESNCPLIFEFLLEIITNNLKDFTSIDLFSFLRAIATRYSSYNVKMQDVVNTLDSLIDDNTGVLPGNQQSAIYDTFVASGFIPL